MHWEKLKAGQTDIDFLLCIRNIVILEIRKAIKGGFLRYQELLLIDASSLFLVGNSLEADCQQDYSVSSPFN